MPRYVLKDVPSVLAADFANPNVSDYFNNTFTVGDKAWSGPEQMIIDKHGYDMRVEVLSGQEEFVALLTERYAKEEPIVFFLWSPNPLMSMFDLVRITLPEDGKLKEFNLHSANVKFKLYQNCICYKKFDYFKILSPGEV